MEMEMAKNITTKMPMTNIDFGSRALTEAESVGIATFKRDSRSLMGKGIVIGSTKVLIKTNKSNERSLRRFAHPYPVSITTTATIKVMPASPNKMTDGDVL